MKLFAYFKTASGIFVNIYLLGVHGILDLIS
jgi:hypothetical protein